MKNALVLGATSEIGVKICLLLAEKCYQLNLAGRDLKKLQNLASATEKLSEKKAATSIFDAANLKSHQKFYRSLKTKPDVVICCIGYFDLNSDSTSEVETSKIMSANFLGIISILNLVVADFEQRRDGQILVLSSVAADRGRQSNYMYGSAKAGLNAYLSGIRNRLHKSGISVTTVKLGPVHTRMSNGQKLIPVLTAGPEKAAAAIVKALEKRKDVVYFKPIWQYIMFIIRIIPESIFKRLPPF